MGAPVAPVLELTEERTRLSLSLQISHAAQKIRASPQARTLGVTAGPMPHLYVHEAPLPWRETSPARPSVPPTVPLAGCSAISVLDYSSLWRVNAPEETWFPNPALSWSTSFTPGFTSPWRLWLQCFPFMLGYWTPKPWSRLGSGPQVQHLILLCCPAPGILQCLLNSLSSSLTHNKYPVLDLFCESQSCLKLCAY